MTKIYTLYYFCVKCQAINDFLKDVKSTVELESRVSKQRLGLRYKNFITFCVAIAVNSQCKMLYYILDYYILRCNRAAFRSVVIANVLSCIPVSNDKYQQKQGSRAKHMHI